MMGKKHVIIEIYDKEQFVFMKQFNRFGKKPVVAEKVSEGHVNLKNKRFTAIIAEEEVLIRILEIPKVKKGLEKELIRKELEHFYGYIEDIIFSYSPHEELEHSMRILVLCINSSKVSWLKHCLSKNNGLCNILVIQLCFYEIYKTFLKAKQFILLVLYEGYHYLMAYRDGLFIGNKTLINEDLDENGVVTILENLLNDYFHVNGDSILESIYIVNEENTVQSSIKNRFDKVEYIGTIDRASLINNLLRKRRGRFVSL